MTSVRCCVNPHSVAEPGWRWSEHVGRVVTGTATAAFDDGRVVEMHAGELFYIPPVPHDSWVVGDEPYVSLHFLGADHYAAREAAADPVEE